MASQIQEEQTLLSSFGRRRGRRLRASKQALMENVLSELVIKIPEEGDLEPKQFFDNKKEHWLEIGFGSGEHLAHQASLHTDIGMIGCEPYINGIAGLLTHVRNNELNNIRIYDDDMRLLIERFPEESLDKVFILYPDPWPKARHHKRRLISEDTLDLLARVMKSGAELQLATDDEAYCTWMLRHVLAHEAFHWQAQHSDDWLKPPSDWIATRYEKKALAAGRVPTYLGCIRL